MMMMVVVLLEIIHLFVVYYGCPNGHWVDGHGGRHLISSLPKWAGNLKIVNAVVFTTPKPPENCDVGVCYF